MTQHPNGESAIDSAQGGPVGAGPPHGAQADSPGRYDPGCDPDSEPPETGYGYRPAEFSPDDFE